MTDVEMSGVTGPGTAQGSSSGSSINPTLLAEVEKVFSEDRKEALEGVRRLKHCIVGNARWKSDLIQVPGLLQRLLLFLDAPG